MKLNKRKTAMTHVPVLSDSVGRGAGARRDSRHADEAQPFESCFNLKCEPSSLCTVHDYRCAALVTSRDTP